MPVTPTYPGVYVQEVPSGVRTIAGVSTSIAMFIGAAKKGPMFQPVRCTNYTDFVRAFSADTSAGQLPNYIRLFFLNGGTDCYVMRIAHGAGQAEVTLSNEASSPTLRLIAKDAGAMGNNLRAVVNYSGAQPEATFNLELFRLEIDSAGGRVKKDSEVWKNLSMDPASPLYAQAFLTQNSKLVNAVDLNGPPSAKGSSLSGRVITASALGTLLSTKNKFQISVDGSPYVEVDLTGVAATAAAILAAVNTALSTQTPTPVVTASFVPGPAGRLQITSTGSGDVFIRPSPVAADLAVPLMLGTSQGGIEVSRYAALRPAPTGLSTKVSTTELDAFANTAAAGPFSIALQGLNSAGSVVSVSVPLSIETVSGGIVVVDSNPSSSSPNGNSDGVREKLALIAQQINNFTPAAGVKFSWKAELWGSRLGIQPGDIFADNYVPGGFSSTAPATFVGLFQAPNVHFYSVGLGGPGKQGSPLFGSDGAKPTLQDYRDAFPIIDKEVDLFNLMVLPPDAAVPIEKAYGEASTFCQQRRAFLLMDPPTELGKVWDSAQKASTGVAALRVGLVKDYSAVFFPNLTIDDNGLKKNIGPAGAIAGLCARTDGTRGVWKAPAGTDADLRGVIGLEQRFSDGENGILNPRAVNTIRIFPNGIVNWGARTMDGDNDFGSEYKYIPIRRLALYMEESLYRGLKWVVFEPNDEPLWAQIRLNVGAFMHNLFRQGAFQGTTPKDAYFVKCDKETTTQNDRNLGIVNIWVGFAPLKPAEFVILYLQQMAGQIEV